ncbi:ribbon-helix-helix protein, CopG family [Streptomyces sp. NPDC002994]|uniref:ribbon-helix-helix protein, CopG family n=1 Tax=Streptomyces sp. NPDC002994 TaxID=3154441 RepID=UPI0033BDC28B
MKKTTVYLPEDLKLRLDAESAATGVSKAELIRQGIALLLDNAPRLGSSRPLPAFNSGRALIPEAMDDAVSAHIKARTARR